MGLESKVSTRSGRIIGVAKDIFAVVAFLGVLSGIVFVAYSGTNINRENIRQTFAIEGSGQRVEYLVRTPRKDLLRLLPWNDSDGHAIIMAYDGNGVKEKETFDEDYDGSLLGESDRVVISIDGKTVKCFANKAINSKGENVPFVDSRDPILNAMVEGARGYCRTQTDAAEALYMQVLQQVKRH